MNAIRGMQNHFMTSRTSHYSTIYFKKYVVS